MDKHISLGLKQGSVMLRHPGAKQEKGVIVGCVCVWGDFYGLVFKNNGPILGDTGVGK